MTDKEKAKAYDNALNWMRSVYPTMTGAFKEDAEHYFPELKESEDEKIRKEILSYLKSSGAVTNPNWVAWLEKQGEQKPAWSEEDEQMINDIIEAIDEQYAVSDYQEMVNWLKSLKERYTWKPSEEQIRVLEYYMNVLNCNEHKEVLFGLYEQLKSL